MISAKDARKRHAEWRSGLVPYTVKLPKAMAAELEQAAKEANIREEQFIAESVEVVLVGRRMEKK